ncbi:MAG: hypothetical protein KGM98_07970 [Bacteroidota bacterium]|nr:hypothetical protein [Bacteroidota bacterium]
MQAIFIGVFIGFFTFYTGYLINYFLLQSRAKNELEKIMMEDSSRLKVEFDDLLQITDKDIKSEKLLLMIREEIEKLSGMNERKIMKKTLDTKNFNNQKRYAEKIFSDIGLYIPGIRL